MIINPKVKFEEWEKYLKGYIETRYPGDIPEFIFDEARKAFEAALRIKEFILDKISKKND